MGESHRISATDFIDHGSETYTFLEHPLIDALVQVVIELGSETWVTRRRMLVLERVMAEQGLLAGDLIETYKPTAEDEALWREERDRMMRSLYAALARPPVPGDQAAARAQSAQPLKRPPLNSTKAAPRERAKGVSGV